MLRMVPVDRNYGFPDWFLTEAITRNTCKAARNYFAWRRPLRAATRIDRGSSGLLRSR